MPAIEFFSPLSFQDIATIFSQPITSIVIDRYYRGGTIVSEASSNQQIPVTGALSVSDFYGNATGRVIINLTIAADTYNFDVYANRGAGYVAGSTDINVVVNSGVYVGSTGASTPAMSVPNSFNANDRITVTNYGYIYGRGGNGGGGYNLPGNPGSAGTTGLYVNRPTTVSNYGELSGGGGGGGGGAIYIPNKGPFGPGGGGGGGAGFVGGSGGGGFGSGGSGTLNSGGAGGGGQVGQTGGSGGGRGAAGTNGSGISGANPGAGGSGGAGGYSVLGNAYITWLATGTRTGPIG